MNKTKKGVDYSKATPDLVKRVECVIADSAKHVYSVSKIYGAYNEAFGLRETPQTCSSCLRNRARMLSEWLAGYEKISASKEVKPSDPNKDVQKENKVNSEPKNGQIEDVNNPHLPAPAQGVIRIPMAEGDPIDLTPTDETDKTKGALRHPDGGKVAAGRYTTAKGDTLIVQVGSKGRIEKAPTEDDLL